MIQVQLDDVIYRPDTKSNDQNVAGRLMVKGASLRFENVAQSIDIAPIRHVSSVSIGIAKWVKIDYGTGVAPSQAYFADGRAFGLTSIFGSSERILNFVTPLLGTQAQYTPPPYNLSALKAIRAICDYAIGQIENELADATIQDNLLDLGLDAVSVTAIVSGLGQVRQLPGQAQKEIRAGALWFFGGVIVSVLSYMAIPYTGGRYVIAIGALAVGARQLISGFNRSRSTGEDQLDILVTQTLKSLNRMDVQQWQNAAQALSEKTIALVRELIQIGETDGYITEQVDPKFDNRLHNIRAKQIGNALNSLGGAEVMHTAAEMVRERLGTAADDLALVWNGIGEWIPG